MKTNSHLDKKSTDSSKFDHRFQYPRFKKPKSNRYILCHKDGKKEKQDEKELDNEVEDKEKAIRVSNHFDL